MLQAEGPLDEFCVAGEDYPEMDVARRPGRDPGFRTVEPRVLVPMVGLRWMWIRDDLFLELMCCCKRGVPVETGNRLRMGWVEYEDFGFANFIILNYWLYRVDSSVQILLSHSW